MSDDTLRSNYQGLNDRTRFYVLKTLASDGTAYYSFVPKEGGSILNWGLSSNPYRVMLTKDKFDPDHHQFTLEQSV